MPDPLALDEVGVEPGRARDAGVRQFLGDLARALLARLDQPDADPLFEEDACDRKARRPAAVDDTIITAPLAARHDPVPTDAPSRESR